MSILFSPQQHSGRYFQLFCLLSATIAYSPSVTLTTTSRLPQTQPERVHRFLASPANWPRIVASSHSVQSSNNNLSEPLPVHETVDEIFGLPPVLPLSITWECLRSHPPTGSTPGLLEFYSANGVAGLASQCQMLFDIRNEDSKNSTTVQLVIQYEPESVLAILAIPVLTLDNALALRVFLPWLLLKSPLNQFRTLMGTLYGVAGLAHLFDCLLGSSQLLVAAGAPPLEQLSLSGQAYAILWCVMGPVAFGLSRIGSKTADFGLIAYGVVEVLGACLIQQQSSAVTSTDGYLNPLANAILVQTVVALSWLYSSQRRIDAKEE